MENEISETTQNGSERNQDKQYEDHSNREGAYSLPVREREMSDLPSDEREVQTQTENSNVELREKRGRKMTDKGRLYQIGVLHDKCRSNMTTLWRFIPDIQRHIDDKSPKASFKWMFTTWCDKYNEYKDTLSKLSVMTGGGGISLPEFESHSAMFADFDHRVKRYEALPMIGEDLENVDGKSDVSNRSKASRAKSNASAGTNQTRLSQQSSVKEQMLDVKTKMMELQIDKDAWKMEEEVKIVTIEAEKRQKIEAIERERRLSDIRTSAEIKKNRVRLELMEDYLKDEEGTIGAKSGWIPGREPPNNEKDNPVKTSLLHANATEFFPSGGSGTRNAIPKVDIPQTIDRECTTIAAPHVVTTNTLRSVPCWNRHREKPMLEPDVFAGDVREFMEWLADFQILIEQEYQSPIERLYYLKKFTKGEARSCVSGLLKQRSEEAYTLAMNRLKERYGNEVVQADIYRKRLEEWPRIKHGDYAGLRELADFLGESECAMASLPPLKVLEDPNELRKVLGKIPTAIHDLWLTKAYAYTQSTGHKIPPFSMLCNFLESQALIHSQPVRADTSTRRDPEKYWTDKQKTSHTRCLATSTEEESPGEPSVVDSSESKNPNCPLCMKVHTLDKCAKFGAMRLDERRDFVRRKGLCWGCLSKGHLNRNCRWRLQCEKCGRQHPTLLHSDSRPNEAAPLSNDQRRNPRPAEQQKGVGTQTQTEGATCLLTGTEEEQGCVHTVIIPVQLYKEDEPGKFITVYAVLDGQSNASFITQSTLEKIQICGKPVSLSVSHISGTSVQQSEKVSGLAIRGVKSNEAVKLPSMYSNSAIPIQQSQIPKSKTVGKWPHLRKVAEQLPEYNPDIEVGLLIGANCPKAAPRVCIWGR